MFSLIQRFDTTPAPIPEDIDLPPFAAPALGEVFDFTVAVRLSWRSSGRRALWPDQAELDQIDRIVRRTVRATTRGHSVFEVEAAEAAVGRALGQRLDDVPRTDPEIVCRWSALAELALPEDARQARRDHLSEMYRIEARARETKLRVDKLRESGEVWKVLLQEAGTDPLARYAVRLAAGAGDGEVAGTVEQMLDQSRKDAEELLLLVAKITEAQRTADVHDIVLASDEALRTAFKRLGIPLPQSDPDAMFRSLDEAS
ncbi:hypothetical protein ACFYSC_29200 [Streptosporangium sp. NPDC004379]|uniref:hypothetical protein n=1 Tax=Streptosporangium sp. NPDC004379 TaxID=3366189 RepID=UPI0036D1FAEE